jgi:excisionase family DNA binding protein
MTINRFNRRRLRKNVIPPSSVRLLSVSEIARRYGFHENTVRRWVTEDEIRCIRYGPGNKIYIEERVVDEFIKRFYEY